MEFLLRCINISFGSTVTQNFQKLIVHELLKIFLNSPTELLIITTVQHVDLQTEIQEC